MQLNMIVIIWDRYMIFESQDNQFSKNLWQMMIMIKTYDWYMIIESQDNQFSKNHM